MLIQCCGRLENSLVICIGNLEIVTNKIRTAKRHYYAQKFNAMKNNVRGTWILINSVLRSDNVGVSRLSIKKL